MSTMERTLALLRKEGWTLAIVEKWLAAIQIRQDMFGFADVVAIGESLGIMAVQVCADSGRAAHRTKILAEKRALTWLRAGGRILLISWGKHGPRGGRKVWEAYREEITEEQIKITEAAVKKAECRACDGSGFVTTDDGGAECPKCKEVKP